MVRKDDGADESEAVVWYGGSESDRCAMLIAVCCCDSEVLSSFNSWVKLRVSSQNHPT
jgi:hypothetical protein